MSALTRLAATVLRRGSSPDSFGEKPADYYDDVYANSEEYKRHYTKSRYYFVWTVIADRIIQGGFGNVLEIGCGSGQLAHLLIDQGVQAYCGFDFSREAIELAQRKRIGRSEFMVDNALTSKLLTDREYDVVICTEVLEHIEEDLAIVQRIRPGAHVLCTVPDFPYKSHVRHFNSAEEVRDRYGRYVDGIDVTVFRRGETEFSRYFLFSGVRNRFST